LGKGPQRIILQNYELNFRESSIKKPIFKVVFLLLVVDRPIAAIRAVSECNKLQNF